MRFSPVRLLILLGVGVFAHAAPPLLPPAASSVTISTPTVQASSAAPVYGWRQGGETTFHVGENLKFVVKWGVVTAGFSTLTIPDLERIDGRPAYHLLSEARSTGVAETFYKVRDRNESWVDTASFTTVRYQKTIREGRYRVNETGVIDQILGRYVVSVYRADKNTYENREGEVPPHTLDILGSLYYVRTLPMEVGKSFTIDVFSGKRVYPLEVNVRARQTIRVPAGRFDCFLVEPQLREPGIFVSKGRKLQVWLTADEHRTPVRMRSEVAIGHVSAELLPAASDAAPKAPAKKAKPPKKP
jgi:hypothetical protein